jgi:hypothetical protein
MPGRRSLLAEYVQNGRTMIQHEYAQVNGMRLHHVTAGSGTLLLFLPGLPDFWFLWNNQIAQFARQHIKWFIDAR